MRKRKLEIKLIFAAISLFFLVFLTAPLLVLLGKSFDSGAGLNVANYTAVIGDKSTVTTVMNSVKVSLLAAMITTVLAFFLSYTVNCTKICRNLKRIITVGVLAPMLLPTITYGFAIIYSFGKQGLLTKLFGRELFAIYGFSGLLLGYVIYTLPPAFLLLNNSFGYIDKKFMIVSALMGDGVWRRFSNTVLRPLVGTIGGAFILSFILSFTDFGIPASVGGTYDVIATELYQVMLGSIPDFHKGSAVAMLMLLPAVGGVLFLQYLERFNFHYENFSTVDLPDSRLRDWSLAVISIVLVVAMLSVFLVMFVAPLVKNYPYDMSFSLQFVQKALFTNAILGIYQNSVLVAGASAIIGTAIAYSAAVINVRTAIGRPAKFTLDLLAMVTNTVPGMVLGLAYLLLFNDSDIKGTFLIIVVCNIVHFFATPYLMAKNSLGKLNPAWETTAELMGDTWIKTIFRVIIPNSAATIVEMFGYYFINAMVTISAVIFLVTARTSVVTSKIKELQHFASFNEIFVLSILIFITNLAVKAVCDRVNEK
ncbi:MAG TPA: ABC transporter permease subunit [Patescibacteria group bacterium]|nr:ABC transporter permease subunit [Patescibacteria group bacterium]